ncbi:MAG TPA: hypothetical protein VGD67_13045 [Pseudonocardiaceae bacterium]
MDRDVVVRRSGDGYVIGLTPDQLELVQRVLSKLYSGGRPEGWVVALIGAPPAELDGLLKREVDLEGSSRIEVEVSAAGLRVLFGAVMSAYLGRSSEETFLFRYGFYSENVQRVGWGFEAALRELDEHDREGGCTTG